MQEKATASQPKLKIISGSPLFPIRPARADEVARRTTRAGTYVPVTASAERASGPPSRPSPQREAPTGAGQGRGCVRTGRSRPRRPAAPLSRALEAGRAPGQGAPAPPPARRDGPRPPGRGGGWGGAVGQWGGSPRPQPRNGCFRPRAPPLECRRSGCWPMGERRPRHVRVSSPPLPPLPVSTQPGAGEPRGRVAPPAPETVCPRTCGQSRDEEGTRPRGSPDGERKSPVSMVPRGGKSALPSLWSRWHRGADGRLADYVHFSLITSRAGRRLPG